MGLITSVLGMVAVGETITIIGEDLETTAEVWVHVDGMASVEAEVVTASPTQVEVEIVSGELPAGEMATVEVVLPSDPNVMSGEMPIPDLTNAMTGRMVTVACRRNNTDPDLPPNINVMVSLEGPIYDLVDSDGNIVSGSSYTNSGYINGSSATIEDPSNTFPDSSHFSLTRHYVYGNSTSPLGTNVITLGADFAGRSALLKVTGTRDVSGQATLLEVEGFGSEVYNPQAFPPHQTQLPVVLDANGSVAFTTRADPVNGGDFSYFSAATLLVEPVTLGSGPLDARLRCLGYSKSMKDNLKDFLVDRGQRGPVTEAIYKELRHQGYTGTMSDMLGAKAKAEGYASVSEMMVDRSVIPK